MKTNWETPPEQIGHLYSQGVSAVTMGNMLATTAKSSRITAASITRFYLIPLVLQQFSRPSPFSHPVLPSVIRPLQLFLFRYWPPGNRSHRDFVSDSLAGGLRRPPRPERAGCPAGTPVCLTAFLYLCLFPAQLAGPVVPAGAPVLKPLETTSSPHAYWAVHFAL
jgi:hypothetical protein